MTEPKSPETPGMSEGLTKFVDAAEAAAATLPSSASVPDDPLTALVDDYYTAYIARDAADDARDEAGLKANDSDPEATCAQDSALLSERVHMSSVFEDVGTLTPNREQISRYSQYSPSEANKLTKVVMQHLEEYGDRCIAAFEAQGWPEKQAESGRSTPGSS